MSYVPIRITLFHLCADTEDFWLSRTELRFSAGTNNGTIQTFAIIIVDDDFVEGTETFVISGSVTSPATFLPGRNMATITIMDNERKLYVKLTVKVVCICNGGGQEKNSTIGWSTLACAQCEFA